MEIPSLRIFADITWIKSTQSLSFCRGWRSPQHRDRYTTIRCSRKLIDYWYRQRAVRGGDWNHGPTLWYAAYRRRYMPHASPKLDFVLRCVQRNPDSDSAP